jgi:predicted ATP-dependent protease
VLPIGGLKEKTLAAQRAGISTVILPSRNEADLEDVPEELRSGMRFIPVERVEQVWEAAMGLRIERETLDLIEAGELIEEAGELLDRARRKAARKPAARPAGKTRVARPAAEAGEAAPRRGRGASE